MPSMPPLADTAKYSLTDEELKQFNEQGYTGPFTLFKEEEIDSHFNKCKCYPDALLPWRKSRHAAVSAMAKIGMDPVILDKVVSILGQDILLWGSQIIQQKPYNKHNIHIDIEHTAWEGITIWLALKNVVGGASFCVIPGSHLFELSTKDREDINTFKQKNDELILDKAQKLKAASRLEYLNIKNGEFIIFNGLLWHGTKNETPNPRFSLIFQYTRPESMVKIPKNYNLLHTTWYRQQPPCLLVHGQDKFKRNKLISFSEVKLLKNITKGILYYLPRNGIRKLSRFLKIE